MRTIITNLSEQLFLNRLDSMCTKHNKFDKGYTNQNVFVVKKNQKTFRIGRHLADIPFSRYDGYFSDFIYGKYIVNSSGKVEINYRFGRPIVFIIPDIIICLVALPIFVCVLYDTIFNAYYQWGGLFVSMIFSFIGLFNLFSYSKKNRNVLEEHLCKICFPNNWENQAF